MKRWVMVVVGVLNVAFGMGGIFYSVFMLWARRRVLLHTFSMSAWIVFLLLLTASSLLAGYLAFLGVRLLGREESAISHAAVLFGIEILFFLAYVGSFWIVIPLMHPQWPGLAGHLFGMIQGPLAPQIVTGYPVLGLLSMLFIKRRDAVPGLTSAL